MAEIDVIAGAEQSTRKRPNRTKLTQPAVDALSAPSAGRIEIWDTVLPGFGLRISAPRHPGGAPRKTWQAMYRVNGKLVRETLGTLATIPKVGDAREWARESMRRAAAGINPVRERKDAQRRRAEAEEARRRDTLSAAIDRYTKDLARKPTAKGRLRRPEYICEVRRTLERDVKPVLGDKPIAEITRGQIRELIEAVVDRGSPSHANHLLAYLRAMLNWAVKRDLIERSPAAGLDMPAPSVERDRTLIVDKGEGNLDYSQIRLFWLGCERIGWPFGPLFKLLLLTAQRRDELAGAMWKEFDLMARVWTLPRERTKNDKEHLIHLSLLAIEVLEALPKVGTEGFLFATSRSRSSRPVSGFGRARERLAAAIAEENGGEPIEAFTLHDLRRTAATGMAALGIAHHVLDRVLNHQGGKIQGVARIYNRHAYEAERRAALDAWSRHIENLIRPTPSNVVELREVTA